MAEPAWWETIPADQIWDPLTNAGDWVELAAESGTEPGGSWARDDASVSYVGDIPFVKQYDARRKMLGYAYADTASPWALHRVNPIPHPRERALRCVSADIAGYNPEGWVQPSGATKGGYPAPYLDPAPAAGTILFPRVSTYSRARCTLKFRPHPYPFYEDATMVAEGWPEVYRNCAFFDSCEPLLDVVTVNGTEPFLVWAETATGGPTVGDPIPSATPEYIQRANFVAIWYHVPYEFIVPSGGYIPTKIMNGMGKVNSTTWYGFPAGTLRLEAPRFRKANQAVIRVRPDLGYSAPPFCFDVMLPFSWVDPTTAVGSPIYRGWNVSLFSNTGKFFSVKRKSGDPDPQPYFPTYDFDKIFEHADKP